MPAGARVNRGSTPAQPPPEKDATGGSARLARVEQAVATLTEAVKILAHGPAEYPQAEPDRLRAPHAARRASELLLSAGR